MSNAKRSIKMKLSIKKVLVITSVLLIFSGIVGFFYLSNSQFGTIPSEEKIQSFKESKQYNQDLNVFQNRRLDLIAKDREAAMNIDFMLEWFSGGKDTKPVKELPEAEIDIAGFLEESDKFKFIWLGHSSLLMNIEGKIVLVDPIFSNVASPVSFIARRFQPPVVDIKDLPNIDLILISHDHYDHLDMETIKFFKDKNITFITPLGVGSHLEGWGVNENKIVEKDWMESFVFKDIEFIATPSQHFSGRGLSDANKTLWASWVIRTPKYTTYFSGDSGYDEHFKDIGEKYGPFDLAFMENGQYDNRFKAAHMLPEEVAIAYQELQAKKVFPIHWGMFALNTHPWYEPPQRLIHAVKQKGDVVTPLIGQLYDLDQLPTLAHWWNN